MCRERVCSITHNAAQFPAEMSTGFMLLVYRSIHFYIVSKCVRKFEFLMVLMTEIWSAGL
jgi:hypothetical protein